MALALAIRAKVFPQTVRDKSVVPKAWTARQVPGSLCLLYSLIALDAAFPVGVG